MVSILELLRQHGYEADMLFAVDEAKLSGMNVSEEMRLALRFFAFPMSAWYVIENSAGEKEQMLETLGGIFQKGLLRQVDSYPLHMKIDRNVWDFYKTVHELSPASEVQLNITNRCINRCKMCRKYEWPQIDLPLVKIREIIEDLRAMGTRQVILSGGEPLLHHDFNELMVMLEGMTSLILTSGAAPLSDETAKKAKWIQFSVDALDPKIYRTIRGPGNIEVVKKNILKAKDAGCSVSVTTVIQKDNALHVPDIIEFCEKEHIPFLPSVVHSYDELSFYNITKRTLPALCVIPLYHCLIDPAGDIFVCCHHHEDNTDYHRIDRRFVLGNVFDKKFCDIWYSDKARNTKKWLLDNRAGFCHGCFRYLLENDAASSIRSNSSPESVPYTHTYIVPLDIFPRYKTSP